MAGRRQRDEGGQIHGQQLGQEGLQVKRKVRMRVGKSGQTQSGRAGRPVSSWVRKACKNEEGSNSRVNQQGAPAR